MKILAHRGFSGKAFENSRAAFLLAFETEGCDGIECDLQKTSDGVYVIFHDPDLKRVFGLDRKIDTMTWIELKTLKLPNGEAVLSLIELLELIPNGKTLNLELKKETIELEDLPNLVRILEPHRKRIPLLVSSFEHSLLFPLKKAGIPIGLLFGDEHRHLGATGVIRTMFRMRPDYLNLPYQAFEVLPAKAVHWIVKFARLLGIRCAFWTINEKEHYDWVKASAAIVITDWPDRFNVKAG